MAVYYMVDTMYESYKYDTSGNRETFRKIIPNEIDELTIYTYYENTNRVMTDNDYSYIWDANGNLTEKGKEYIILGEELIFDNEEGEYWKYEYDLLNRLLRVSKSNAGTDNAEVIAEYTYDHNGYRVKKVRHADVGVETTYYIFGLGGSVLYKEQVDKDTYEEFVFVAGKYFAKYEGKLSETIVAKYFYHTDHLGSVTVVTDEAGNAVWAEEFLAFGLGTGVTGLIESPKIYIGKELDEDVGLYYFNARWYDPAMGRFVTEDPVKDGGNWYVYCANNPLVLVDLHGLSDYSFDEDNIDGFQAKVEKNDTLSKISMEWYGSYNYVDLIAEYNNIKNKNLIFVGQEIALPAIAELVGIDKYFNNRIDYLKDESTMLNNQTKILAENLGVDTESITYTLIPPPTDGKGVNPIVVVDMGMKGMKAGLHHMGIDVDFGIEIGNDAVSVTGHHSIITDDETVRLNLKGFNEGFSPGGVKITDDGVKYEQPKFNVNTPTIPISPVTSGKVGIDIKLKDNWFSSLSPKGESQIPIDLIIKGKLNVGIYQFANIYGQLKFNICQTARVYFDLYDHFKNGKELEPIRVK